MIQSEVTQLFRSLLDEKVIFLVAGGFAVVAHGHSRLTHDLDLVLALDARNLKAAMKVFEAHNLSPRIPVQLNDFLDAGKRRQWAKDRNMQVFSLVSPSGRLVVDIFNEEPFDFKKEFENRAEFPWPGMSRKVSFVSKETLIAMKKAAGRTIDLDDIKYLEL